MIKDNQKFLSLIEDKLHQLNNKFSHGFVEYYDKKVINRKINLFEKPLEFEYQKEFRFYVERDSTEPFVFSIGTLVDISELFLTHNIVEGLKIETQK